MANAEYRTYLQERKGGWWYFMYTVPKASWKKVGKTKSGKQIKQIWISLKTRDRREALMKVGPHMKNHMNWYPAGENDNPLPPTYENAVDAASYLGFPYRTAPEYRKDSIREMIALASPVLDARNRIANPSRIQRAAMAGAVDVPGLSWMQAFERFKVICVDKVMRKSEDKAKKFWRKFELSVEIYAELISGDADVLKLTIANAKDFRSGLVGEVNRGRFKSERASDHIEHLRSILDAVLDEHPGDLKNPFRDIKRIKATDAGKGEEFTEDEVRAIRDKIKISNAGAEVKAMLLIAQNTGCYVSELALMAPEDIVIDDAGISHIKIRLGPYRTELKSGQRARDIPLVGDSLAVMKEFRLGFSARFHGDKGVQRLNDKTRKLIKTVVPTKSLKAYRHRMATLLRTSIHKDQVQDAILGHATKGMTGYYGGLVTLQQMKEALDDVIPKYDQDTSI
ncbi:tyrosine-type recombinase/integrase [Rhizobium sp. Root483D2]|uniref:tyrosine-type recombinase/integrase n=1 Tax=Rhizobium sp. Root483D2 TaxID=1736545 RepID=UPI00071483D5|nr:tyrosine-type recombinase/integrase [Rhizobium sp. Root483D2]KQY31853.1 hypothetical protein ASD32_04495 [Rhizobium sp. Root483D2]